MSLSRLRFQNRVLLLVLVAAGPAWLVASLSVLISDMSGSLKWLLLIVLTAFAVGGAFVVRRRVVYPLQSLANLLEALREDDYSQRGRTVDPEDALGEVMLEVNSLSRTLYDQRLEALEAGVLLEKVITEIDIAVFAFDAERRLRLANRAGEALLGMHRARLEGRSAAELGLATMLDAPSGKIASHAFPGGSGRWEIRRRRFREGGRPHELLVISDLSRALREEEQQAWRRLVRVMGHELNSSLAPIKSMAGTVRKLITREPPPPDWRDDAVAGLAIIRDRAESLSRFIGGYARLAKLPPPTRRATSLASLVRHAASLYGEHVEVEKSPDVELEIDGAQIEQVLINLIKNAVEATPKNGRMRVRWKTPDDRLVLEVEDDGPGLGKTENLWVPFFTTKPGGTGLGLVLSREIIENHGGSITLENRADARGCVARVTLPLH